jgi:HSP20 family molecular chaperone IbpA
MTEAPAHVPVRVYQSDGRLMVAVPLPGVGPADIAVRVAGDALTIHGDVRGVRQEARDLLTVEWAIGPYHRELRLPQAVDGARANATYGNGVLVLALPKLQPGTPAGDAEFRLQVLDAPRGQRVGHHGQDLRPTTTAAHRRQTAAVVARAQGAGRETASA